MVIWSGSAARLKIVEPDGPGQIPCSPPKCSTAALIDATRANMPLPGAVSRDGSG